MFKDRRRNQCELHARAVDMETAGCAVMRMHALLETVGKHTSELELSRKHHQTLTCASLVSYLS